MTVIIGSTAIKHYFPDFPREPSDLDYIGQAPTLPNVRMEKHDIPFISDHDQLRYLSPEEMLSLKMSHLFWDVNWDKHMWDVQWLLDKGVQFNFGLIESLYEHWNEFHGINIRSNLNMTKSEFFDNAVNKYDHDYLHTLINPMPTYTKFLKTGKEVEINLTDYFFASSLDKDAVIREEVMVMGFERFPADMYYKRVYSRMLKKYIIGHAPLWSVAIHAILNYKKLLKIDFNFMEILKNGEAKA